MCLVVYKNVKRPISSIQYIQKQEKKNINFFEMQFYIITMDLIPQSNMKTTECIK